MKQLKNIGFLLFALAFIIFNASLFLNRFEITTQSIEKAGFNADQQQLFLQNADPLLGKTLTKSTLIAEVSQVIDKINEQAKAENNSNAQFYNKQDTVFAIAQAASVGWVAQHSGWLFLLTFGLGFLGSIMQFLPNLKLKHKGIDNDDIFRSSLTGGKWLGYVLALYLVSFYIILYFFPVLILEPVLITNDLSLFLTGGLAGKWFLYGTLYTFFVVAMGIRFIIKYRHNKYQVVRTLSVMFFQTAFAFLLPNIMLFFNQPYMDLKNIWPLDYSFFYSYRIDGYLNAGRVGVSMFVWGLALIFIITPALTYFFGKRWYCSWVCGCGGLAETAGDPFRQLSNKTIKAWKFERISIHSVLVFVVLMTTAALYTKFTGQGTFLGVQSYTLQSVYGFLVGSVLAGVVGTGLYPVLGSRSWCRFFCPMAAYLGIIQRFKSRFRITTNGDQCISCGNCSTYCEMGIDVRAYAQKGENIVRASCVGCGICAAVCPRGVLKLENKSTKGRIGKSFTYKP